MTCIVESSGMGMDEDIKTIHWETLHIIKKNKTRMSVLIVNEESFNSPLRMT